jgi:outer membrane protein assembly factor BamB
MKHPVLICAITLFSLTACGGGGMRPPVANGEARVQALATPTPNTTADWSQFGFDQQRDSYNGVENILSATSVPAMKLKWSAHLDSSIFAQPLLLHAVTIGGVSRHMLYVASFFNLFAIDTNASTATTPKILWQKTLPGSYATCGGSTIHNGTWATPYIDRAAQRIYVVDGARYLDAYNIVTGNHLYSSTNPVDSYAKSGVDGALSYDPGTGRLFVATALRCGAETSSSTPMRGQIVSYTASNATPLTPRFTTVTSSGYYGGSIWGMGGVSIDPATHTLFAASGNSWPTSTTTGQHTNYAEHIIQLSTGLQVLSSNYPGIGGSDNDFGATPTLFQPAGCAPMAAVSNKDGELLFYNRNSISSGPIVGRIAMANPSPGDFINAPAFDPATQMLYETSSTDSISSVYKHGLTAFKFISCKPQLAFNRMEGTQAPTGSNAAGDVYSSPTVANGVVYFGAGATDVVYANDARTGAFLKQFSVGGKAQISPMVVDGRLYIVAGGTIYAFGL